jgi:DNA-binding transcriptional LysR family regulator
MTRPARAARPLDPVSLQLYVAVCEEGSVARAAAREALVASALSKRLAALEAELGTPLLVRHARGVAPTPAGEALLARARELLAAMQRARAELGEFADGVQGSVRVLASPSVLAEQLPDDIGRFLARHPRLRVSLDERVSADIVRALLDGAADLGVAWDRVDLADLVARPYRRDRLCVVMPPTHALARRPTLRLAEIVAEATVGVSPGGLLDRLLRRAAARLGTELTHRIQVSSMDAACRIVAAGLGLAILPREVAVSHAGAGRLALVPLAEPWAERQFMILTRPRAQTSAATRLLAQELAAATAA